MPTSSYTIAIVGASGKLGHLITEHLIRNHPEIQIHAIARSKDKYSALIQDAPQVKLFQAASDDKEALRNAISGTDICVCTYFGSPNLMLHGQKLLIDICIEESIPRFMGSEFTFNYLAMRPGQHPSEDWIMEYSSYLAIKEKVSNGTLRSVRVLNGAFMEAVFAKFMQWVDPDSNTFKYYGSGNEVIEMTTIADVGVFAAEVAADLHALGCFNVLGDRKTIPEIARIWGDAFGVETKVECRGSLGELNAQMWAAYDREPKNPEAWTGLFYNHAMADGSIYLDGLDNDRIPNVKAANLREFLQQGMPAQLW